MKQVVLTVAGFLLLVIGLIGIVFPIWPTTPFVLAAIACFSGNPGLRGKLLRIKFIRAHYYNYRDRVGLSASNVLLSLIFLWAVLAVSVILTAKLWVALLLLSVGAAVTAHILIMAKPKAQRGYFMRRIRRAADTEYGTEFSHPQAKD